jgi:hypothetical protein
MTIGITSDLLFQPLVLANFAGGGSIGSAAATVDANVCIQIPQTTAGQTLTVPAPTLNTVVRQTIIQNTGTASFTVFGSLVLPGASIIALWNGGGVGGAYSGVASSAPGGAAGANRAYGSGTATTAGQATITVVAAAKLIAKSTGIFRFNAKISYSAAAATDVATLTTKVFTDAVAGTPLTLGNNGSIGFGSNGVAQPGNVAVNNNGAFTANAGAGITISGASAGFTYDTQVQTIGTAAVGAELTAEGITGLVAPASPETPFALGTTCLVTFSLTNSNAARATANITVELIEL